MQFIIKTATEILDCESVLILLYDEKRGHLVFAASNGDDQKRLEAMKVPPDERPGGDDLPGKQGASASSDVQNDQHPYASLLKTVGLHVKTLLGVPMRIKDKPTGVLEALNKRGSAFDESDADILLGDRLTGCRRHPQCPPGQGIAGCLQRTAGCRPAENQLPGAGLP